jgi:hypothetical protein
MRNDVVLVDGPNPNFFRQTGIVQSIAEAIAADTRLAQKLAKSNKAAAMPPNSMGGQLFCCPHFLPAVAVSTGNYQQLLAPPVPRSRCND